MGSTASGTDILSMEKRWFPQRRSGVQPSGEKKRIKALREKQ
jgi:hypothetical protein